MGKNNYITIQKQILEDIKALQLSNIQKDNCIKFVDILTKKALKESNSIFCSVEIPSNFFLKAFNSKYQLFLSPLKESGIIISNESYSTTRSVCKSYMLNSKYISDQSEMVGVVVKTKEREEAKKKLDYKELFRSDLKTLKIDYDNLYQIIDETVRDLSLSDFLMGSDIPDDNYKFILRIDGKERTGFISLTKALEMANQYGVQVILNKKKLYVMPAQDFLKMKKVSIKLSYTDAVNKLNKGFLFAARNTTNNRLDTNITSFCKKLLQPIIEDNDLVQLDLANSQFAFFAHVTRDILVEEDAILFRNLAISGELYEFIQEKLGLNTRDDAKRVTIELLFGSERCQSKNLKALKQYFPTVIAYINNYKKENGKANFAIMLQQEESALFIDTIYKELKRKKIFCITRHDSLIVKQKNAEEVKAYVQMIFDSIDFEAVMK